MSQPFPHQQQQQQSQQQQQQQSQQQQHSPGIQHRPTPVPRAPASPTPADINPFDQIDANELPSIPIALTSQRTVPYNPVDTGAARLYTCPSLAHSLSPRRS